MTINLRFIIVRIKWWMVFWYELYGIWWECLKCLNGVTFFLINLIVSNGYLFKNASKDRSVSHLFVPVYLRERGPVVHIITEQLNHGEVYGGMHLQTCFFTLFVLFTYSQRTKWCTFKCEEFKTVKYGNYHTKRTYIHAYKNSINKGYCREIN